MHSSFRTELRYQLLWTTLLTLLNRVKNFMLPEFHLVFLVFQSTPKLSGENYRLSCPWIPWNLYTAWQGVLSLHQLEVLTAGLGSSDDWFIHLVGGWWGDQSYGGRNSGGSWGIPFYISVVSPYCSFITEVFPRWFRAQKVYRERERERENQERAVFFIRPSLGRHIASLLPYCIWQSSHEPTKVGGDDSDSWCVMWQEAGKACGTENTAMPCLESPICSNA